MDPQRFDALVCTLVERRSRRAALGLLTVSGLLVPRDAAVAALRGNQQVTPAKHKKKCKHGLKSCKAAAGKRHCVNVDTDPTNCGSCGHACATGQICQTGTCGGCPADRVCGDGCCPSGQTCRQGACVCPPALPTLCGGECVNLHDDPAHCGTCDLVCGSGQGCHRGVCCALTGSACQSRSDCCFELGDTFCELVDPFKGNRLPICLASDNVCCGAPGEPCRTDCDCCLAFACNATTSTCCQPSGEPCFPDGADADCCSGVCSNGACA